MRVAIVGAGVAGLTTAKVLQEAGHDVVVYDKAPEQPTDTYGEWRTRTGDIFSPKVSNSEPLRLECQHFLRLVEEGWDGREMHDGLEVVRALELLTESLHG